MRVFPRMKKHTVTPSHGANMASPAAIRVRRPSVALSRSPDTSSGCFIAIRTSPCASCRAAAHMPRKVAVL